MYRNGNGTFYELGDTDSKLANAIAGEVYPGYELKPVHNEIYQVRGRKIVIKVMDKYTIRHLRQMGHRENPLREISLLQMVGNDTPHVCGLIDAVEDDTHVYSIMQHYGTELFDWAGKLSERKILHCFRQIVTGVLALKSYSLCHRDISLENILVSESGHCTIIDFGLAIIIPQVQQKTTQSVLSTFRRNNNKLQEESDGAQDLAMRPRGDSGGMTDNDDDDDDDDEEEDNHSENSSLEEGEECQYEMDDEEEEQQQVAPPPVREGGEGEEGGGHHVKESDSSAGGRASDSYESVLLLPQGNCGKENYVAPEILANATPFDGLVVDQWALGVLLFMLFTGRPPFIRATPGDQYFRAMQHHPLGEILASWGVAEKISPLATDLLQRLLRGTDPSQRMSCEEILSHPWMTTAAA